MGFRDTCTAPRPQIPTSQFLPNTGPDPRPQSMRSSHGFRRIPCRGLPATCRGPGQGLARGTTKFPTIPPDEDEILHARRIVAQRCLYGVDKNPMAVDLAKLSLWLATLAKDHPFTFLDHALRAGDSLVGLSREQIAGVHWATGQPRDFARPVIEGKIREAIKGRLRIQNADDLRPI